MTDSSTTEVDSLSDSICSNDPPDNKDKRLSEVIDMSRWRDKKMTKQVIRRGKGWSAPRNGNEVSIHYVAKRVRDGAVIDSSRDRNQVFTFIVGRRQVFKGMDIAIKSMKWFEISKFEFEAEYAYDETNCPKDVTPGERISWEVELFYFKLIDLSKKKDGSLTKRIIEPGVGFEIASFGSQCRVDIFGKYEDKVFDIRTVSFTVGEAEVEDVIDGIEVAVTKMRKHEKCRLFVKPNYAFGPKGRPELGIPDHYQQLVYEIRLIDFNEAKEPFEYTDKEKLTESVTLREKANHYFHSEKYKTAYKQYKRMVKLLTHDSSKDVIRFPDPEITPEEFKKERDRLLYIAYQNLSTCCFKVDRFSSALKWMSRGLQLEPDNQKGLYRRGKAYAGLQEYELALKDFKKALELDPNNRSVQNQIIVCEVAIKRRKETEKKLYSKFFQARQLNPSIDHTLALEGDVLGLEDSFAQSLALSTSEKSFEDKHGVDKPSDEGQMTAEEEPKAAEDQKTADDSIC